jgi:carbon storage regulator
MAESCGGPLLKRSLQVLVLSREVDQEVVIGGGDSGYPEVVVILVEMRGNKSRLGFKAPASVPVHRREISDAIKRDAAKVASSDNCGLVGGSEGAAP